MTIGSPDAGTPLVGATVQDEPASPFEAKTVCPCAAASRKTWSSASIEPSRWAKISQMPNEALPALAAFCAAEWLNISATSESVNDVVS